MKWTGKLKMHKRFLQKTEEKRGLWKARRLCENDIEADLKLQFCRILNKEF
jgi:hypothetical protein